MKLIEINTKQLKQCDKFRLSFPLQPERYLKLMRSLEPVPLLVVNEANEVVFGEDLLPALQEEKCIPAFRIDSDYKEALFLAFNLKSKFTGCNLYEKLVFLSKILPLADKEEIYRRSDPDIAINRPLESNLELLTSPLFATVLSAEQVTLKAAVQLLLLP